MADSELATGCNRQSDLSVALTLSGGYVLFYISPAWDIIPPLPVEQGGTLRRQE